MNNSPHIAEAKPGEIVIYSFTMVNESKNEEELKIEFQLPNGWMTFPCPFPPYKLLPGERVVLPLAIKIPARTVSGKYVANAILQGIDHPEIVAKESFAIAVLPSYSLNSQVEEVKEYAMAGEIYDIKVRIVNRGNVATGVAISIKDCWNYCRLEDVCSTIYLEPGEEKLITIAAETDKEISEAVKHIVDIEARTLCDTPYSSSATSCVEIYPSSAHTDPLFFTYPIETRVGYGIANGKSQLFAQFSGEGNLDEMGRRHFDFLFRFPFIDEVDLVNYLYGIPEKFYLRYRDPSLEAYLGDGVYRLSPLTMYFRYGMGASVAFFRKNAEFGLNYVDDTSSVPLKNFGAYFTYSPARCFKGSVTMLKTQLAKRSERLHLLPKESQTYSLRSQFGSKKIFEADVEYGVAVGEMGGGAKNAFYADLQGRPYDSFWYGFRKIYAEPGFVGYYTDTDQFSGSIGFPIIGKLRGNSSYNIYKTNLKKNRDKEFAARDKNFWFGLSYPFPFGVFYNLSYNSVLSKEYRLQVPNSQEGYRVNYVSLGLGRSYKKWNCQGIVEQGAYVNQWRTLCRRWQNYQLYLTHSFSDFFQSSLYSRIGYLLVADQTSSVWTQIYGLSTTWNLGKGFQLRLLYERTQRKDRFNRNFIHIQGSCQLARNLSVEFKGYLSSNRRGKEEHAFLLSCSIPWDYQLPKKSGRSAIAGKIHCSEELPLSNIHVLCNQKETITNEKGEFFFPRLPPGNYSLWVDSEPENYLTEGKSPISCEVVPGRISAVELNLLRCGAISGQLNLYEFEDSSFNSLLFSPQQGEERGELKYKLAKGWNKAQLQIISEGGEKKLSANIHSDGSFTFKKVPPGKWKLRVTPIDLPSYHQIEQEEFFFDLHSGDEWRVEAKILPKVRRVRLLSTL